MTEELETDYLVVGAGGMGMAFVDTVLDESDAAIVMVDRYDLPGGHWRVAYDYVKLHQPSDYYGVNSLELGSGDIDDSGHNAGLLELANLSEIREYYERVMRKKFLKSGRVRYFPNSEYDGAGAIVNLLSGERTQVRATRRVVDSTYMNVEVPAMVPPPFKVAEGATVVTPGELSRTNMPYDRYVVVGGGKTGIDTVLWLLSRGLPSDRITWVMPRDAWLFRREYSQTGPRFAELCDKASDAWVDAWMGASTPTEFFEKLDAAQWLYRLSDQVRPTAFRSATVTRSELNMLRTVKDVVRQGRCVEANHAGIVLKHGSREFGGESVLYVNCTANGLARVAPVPVFEPGKITLQSITQAQQVYGASFIAHIEARSDDDDAIKNALTVPVPHPYDEVDFIHDSLSEFRSMQLWLQDADIVEWWQNARLAGVVARIGTPIPPAGPERESAIEERRAVIAKLIEHGEKLEAYIASAGRDAIRTNAETEDYASEVFEAVKGAV
ncbi:lysine N(6)-hydroxylase/L-ornithine N(5)-oxygenase family protein [Mycobacterium sp. CBMA293]|uniref:NAD(P)/FAD-dependent oxidoreductase n=1 Tax=unclassified Mycolicibacterium TaxID=2636767 RepID=UPI0012DDE12C|nr:MULTISPECIES: NAD(P)/FAD-dependent oxidoreductase [unclassified Mycolicibacterium]MUL49399.1 lysine N(6)-hydroxylase/L-ornithine N(5)-oxygenase family protein [Mycolicibacterium sp. CBMA 360]MUL62575.1 lysine N(6)-hydroxylase/L-ornithine N(5)-oxygenase family protein [Mycolicibacterium sp. CBMA 335]MUL69027.1 lysine N(6)-hydroxylase/L-ornithine N(5)-oxygenase family protein [Mycolicibacterium sp. CBMA 311]MUL96966.1 lysine N(6)-hydroxylase/L-ornithine N(5)-oxygenase family protein [Mycolicib